MRSLSAALLFILGTFAPAMVLADDVLALPSCGIVQSVREVRLTDGRAVTAVQTGTQIFAPGQRVRVVSDGPDARIERADGHPLP